MARPNFVLSLYETNILREGERESSECNSALYSLLILVNLVNFFFVLCVDAGLWPNQFGQGIEAEGRELKKRFKRGFESTKKKLFQLDSLLWQ